MAEPSAAVKAEAAIQAAAYRIEALSRAWQEEHRVDTGGNEILHTTEIDRFVAFVGGVGRWIAVAMAAAGPQRYEVFEKWMSCVSGEYAEICSTLSPNDATGYPRLSIRAKNVH